MAKIEVEDYGSFEVPDGKRLVRALEGNGVDVLHRCGGFAHCTTCRVHFSEGEPEKMTEAEYEKLKNADLLGKIRLSCQIECSGEMKLEVINRLHTTGLDDPGPTPAEEITPEPKWVTLTHSRTAAK